MMFRTGRLLTDLRLELARLTGLTETLTTLARSVADHETRLRRAERWIYALPASVLVGVGTFIASYYVK